MKAGSSVRTRPASKGLLLDAQAATRALNISRASLYVYVSRGLIRSLPHPDNPRACLYRSADIQALVARKAQSRRPRTAAASALDNGLPVLKTRISYFEDDRCFYRGKEAVEYSRNASVEDAARLLWNTSGCNPFARLPFDPGKVRGWKENAGFLHDVRPTDRAILLLSLLSPAEVMRAGKPGPQAFHAAAHLVGALAAALVTDGAAVSGPLHRVVAAAWHRPKASEVLRRALVLLADHELNASTFTVRVVASTGASLVHCVIAGLAAMSGPKHGGATENVRALLAEVEAAGDAESVIDARLGRGEAIPGFTNSVYRDGDPRGAELVSAVKLDAAMTATLRAARSLAGGEPNIDFGLLAIERSFALPKGAALTLFALGRSVGWIAHAFEQRASGKLIRPRADYVWDQNSS
jgi:citrate synthase